MLKKYLFLLSIATILLSTFTLAHAQEKKKGKTESQISQYDGMQKYMEIIASDSTMRKDMMSLMIGKCKGNQNAMIEMAKSITQNQEMNKVMAEILKVDEMIYSDIILDKKMKDDGGTKDKIIMEPTKTIKKPKYDSVEE